MQDARNITKFEGEQQSLIEAIAAREAYIKDQVESISVAKALLKQDKIKLGLITKALSGASAEQKEG